MASDGAASRRPPLAPPPKRRAPGDLLRSDLLTYKRRRRATSANATGGSTVAPAPDQNQMSLMANGGNSQHQALVRHWRSWRDTLEGLLLSPAVNQGSGGIQSCIRDALRHNSSQLLEHGNLGESQGGVREVPSGAVHAKENNSALVKAVGSTPNNGALVKAVDATADNGVLVKAVDATANNGALVKAVHAKENNGALVKAVHANENNGALVKAVDATPNNGALVKAVDATANNGALIKLENGTAASLEANKAKCHNALFEILVSEKFALLCDLLVATFHVNKPDDVIGLQKIDAKMKSGDYAQNPALLDHDIKKIWKKIGHVGQEMVGLASSLSVISQACQKQGSAVSGFDMSEHKIEGTSLVGVADKGLRESTPPCDSVHSTIPKGSETSGLDGICKDCGRKADSEGRIICDRCEAVFHVSCLKPAIDDVPAKWYCPTCNELDAAVKTNSNGKSHEDCNVCEWLDFKEPEEHPEAEDVSNTEVAVIPQESSVSSMHGDSEPDLSTTAQSNLCKHCGTCEDEDKKFLVCSHPFCTFKFYHVLCMKESQIAREKQKNRGCWYCPSCLCRCCFKAKNDELTVLCDGCDDAYHTYCMNPPRNTIPKGSWYCSSCNARRSADGIQKYEKLILESVPAAKRSKTLAGGAPEKK